MKIIRTPVLSENKKIPITMIVVSLLMLFLAICNISIDFTTDSPVLAISFLNTWSLPLSVIPITWGICTFMLMKTKKIMYSKIPAYIFCCLVLLALIILFIAAGDKYFVYKLLGFALAVLLVYPFIITTLTIEGRMYNRVFATVFAVILLILCISGAVAVCIILKSIVLSTLIPSLIYVELILNVLCYRLEKPHNSTDSKQVKITH